MKNKGEKQLGKVASKIYLYAYPRKRSRYYIAKKIYGHDHHSIARTIKNEDLVERKYIVYEEIKDEKGKIINHLAFSKIDPIMERIDESSIGSKLNNYDKSMIKRILDSQGFRKIIDDDIKKLKHVPVDSVQHILLLFEIWVIISQKFRPLFERYKELGFRTNFRDENDYNQYFEKIRPIINAAIPVVAKSITHKKVNRDYLLEFNNVFDLFIPDNVLKKLKPGISSIGILFSTYDQALNKMQKEQRRAEKILITKEKKITNEVVKKINK